MQKIVAVLAVFGICLGVALADEFSGLIKKIDGNKVTVQKTKFNQADKKFENDGNEVTLTASDSVKVTKGKFNKEAKKIDAGDPLDGGLNNDTLRSGKARAAFVTEGDKITEIRVIQFGKKKNN